MSGFLLLLIKFFHLLGFVYWLGGDLGTYYASFESNYALVLQPSAEVCVPAVGCIELKLK